MPTLLFLKCIENENKATLQIVSITRILQFCAYNSYAERCVSTATDYKQTMLGLIPQSYFLLCVPYFLLLYWREQEEGSRTAGPQYHTCQPLEWEIPEVLHGPRLSRVGKYAEYTWTHKALHRSCAHQTAGYFVSMLIGKLLRICVRRIWTTWLQRELHSFLYSIIAIPSGQGGEGARDQLVGLSCIACPKGPVLHSI